MEENPNFNCPINDELLQTADAITIRQMKNNELISIAKSVIMGVPYESPPKEQVRAEQLGRKTLMLLSLENPDLIISNQQRIDCVNSDEVYRYRAEHLSSSTNFEIVIDPSQLKAEENSALEQIFEASDITPELMAEAFSKDHQAVKKVAEAEDVPVSEVYIDDNLYYQAMKLALSPDDFVLVRKRVNQNWTSNKFKELLLHLNGTLKSGLLNEGLDESEAEQFIQDMRETPEINHFVSFLTESTEEASRQCATYRFIKTYGYDKLLELTPEQQSYLLPRTPWIPEVFGDILNSSD